MSSVYIPICSCFIIGLINLIFFLKRKVNNNETKIYGWMIIANLLESLIASIIVVVAVMKGAGPVHYFLNKLDYMFIILWIWGLFTYVNSLSNKNHLKRMIILSMILNVIVAILISFAPITVISENGIMNSYGIGTNIAFITVAIYMIIIIMYLIKNTLKDNSNLKNQKYIPIYVLIILIIIMMMIRLVLPELTLISFAMTYVSLIMYFTIENPDVHLIEQLNIAKEQAEKANHAKTDFLSSMSHEIRTPLNAIVGFSQALIEEEIPDAAKDEVEDIITASLNLLDIVNGILDISKIEANKLEIVNTEYSLRKVLDELTVLTKARIGDKSIEFRTHFDESIPPVLYGDYIRLKQIVLNLLTNAAKYTKEGFIDFEVHSVITGDICRLIISVKDTGIGIKEKNLDKLFTKFERFDKEQNITIEGTGLGLAITKKLTELMHGSIVAQSVYGEGSQFTVAIDQQVVAKEQLEAETVTTDKIDITGKHILIVDDNTINLKVATRLLKNYDVTIDTCESGGECLDKIKNGNEFDLILLDDMMPKMSGVETLQKLKQEPNFCIPTVVLTANAISGMKEKYLQDGFDDYLAKPIDKTELNRVLERFLTQKNQEHDIIKVGCDTMKDVNYLKDNGIDVNKSLELFGDMETYNETMVDFFSAVKEKLEKIKKYKETSDMANYAIEVHSLKSDSKYLGFTTLADFSYQHEMASKAMDTNFVLENYDSLMLEANRIVAVVSTYLGKQNTVAVEKKALISDKKILVVDDSNVIRNLIERMFNDEIQVVSAKDGVEATQIISSTPIATIYGLLLDLNMPKADGFAVLDWFKKYNLFAKIPVAIITGEDSKENVERAHAYPIVGVVPKPFNERDVKNIVNDMRNFK